MQFQQPCMERVNDFFFFFILNPCVDWEEVVKWSVEVLKCRSVTLKFWIKVKESKKKRNAPKVRYNVIFLKKLFAPTRKVCKE